MKLIETGQHQAVTVQGKLHGCQVLRLGELIQSIIEENGGWGWLHLELRGGDIYKVSKETSELFSPEKLRTTA
jgi:hypothetical protein